jgi:peptidoglycan hydrolase-like protein with peptidoglycan-binding domain
MGSCPHELCASKVRGIENYHLNHGYVGIAYNEVDCEHGVRFEGRPKQFRSAANGPQANSTHYAYCGLRGVDDAFPGPMQAAMAECMGEIGGERLAHKDVNATACPGPDQYAFIHGNAVQSSTPAPRPPATTTPSAPILRRGSTGASVQQLQTWLATVGFSPGAADGDFGPKTEAAVKAFQTSAGIQVDGIAGPETLAHLWGALSARRPGTPTVASVKNPNAAVVAFITQAAKTVLRVGSKGAFVALLQDLLNKKRGAGLRIDGNFGPATKAAVEAFQRGVGIGVDGIVGPLTWGRLLR